MKKEFLTGLTVVLLSIGLVLAGCESPTNGSNGGSGTNALPADTATTAAGAEKFWAEGRDIVYFAGALTLGDGGEPSLTVPDGKTLILADVADLQGRAVAANGKGSITVKSGGTLAVNDAKLVVHNGSNVTVAAGTGTVNLTGAATVVVGTPGVVPAAADAPVFAIKGGTVTASSTATLSFTSGATLEKSGGTLTAASGTAFAFEDPANLDTTVVEAIAAAGSTALNVGGTIDADGKVEAGTGTTIDPNGGASFESTEAAFLTALSGSTVLVSYTGAETVNSTGNYNLTGRAVSLTNPAAELVIGTGTVTVAGGAGVSMWAPFSGAGKITVSGTGTLAQDSNFGIGANKELVLTTTSKVTYNLGGNTLTVAGTGTEGAGTVTVTSSDGLNLTRNLTIAAGATLTLGSNHINLYAPVTLTVNGTLDAGNTTGTITLVPGSTLTVNGTVNALGSTNTAGAILLGGSPATGVYTVNGTGRIKLSGSAAGPLFAVATNQTLAVTGVTLDGLSIQSDITAAANSIAELTGRAAALTAAGFAADTASNTYPLVTVSGTGAVLTLNAGAKVAGNTVVVSSTHAKGAGVSVTSGGTLTIAGGEVSYNTIVATATALAGGAGVFVDQGTITMTGGSISKNYIVANGSNSSQEYYGAGVALSPSGTNTPTFTFSGGSVSDNFIGGSGLGQVVGGGVRVDNGDGDAGRSATLTMTGGSITGNKLVSSVTTKSAATAFGGSAVALAAKGTFTMSGGEISNNVIDGKGRFADGAVRVGLGESIFNMSGGTISGNTATTIATGTNGTEGIYPVKGVQVQSLNGVTLSGSATIADGVFLTPSWAGYNPTSPTPVPTLHIGTLTGSGIVAKIDLCIGPYELSSAAGKSYPANWADKPILTGGASYISRFELGEFSRSSFQHDPLGPVATTKPDGSTGSMANGEGYVLEVDDTNVKLVLRHE